MISIPFTPAYLEGGGTSPTVHYTAGGTLVNGTIVKFSTGTVVEIGTDDVTGIVGVAGAANQSDFGYDMGDSPVPVTGRVDTVPVWVPGRTTVFMGSLTNAGTLSVPAIANVGVQYGVIKMSDGTWAVDTADTTNKVVTITDFDLLGVGAGQTDYGRVYFKFIYSTLAV